MKWQTRQSPWEFSKGSIKTQFPKTWVGPPHLQFAFAWLIIFWLWVVKTCDTDITINYFLFLCSSNFHLIKGSKPLKVTSTVVLRNREVLLCKMMMWHYHVPACTVKRKGAEAESRSDDQIFPSGAGSYRFNPTVEWIWRRMLNMTPPLSLKA